MRDSASTIASWLGTNVVHNERRDYDEPTARYALRHTRLLPRDIVVLGNEFCSRMVTRAGTPRKLTHQEIRNIVHRCAVVFGREQLAICANQITADMMHEGAALHEIAELYTGSDPSFHGAQIYLASMRDKLSGLIRSLGRDCFDRDEFLRLREYGRELFSWHTDPMAVLWQNGLLGIVPDTLTDGRAIFYSASAHHELWIEDAAPRYAFHPCLVDTLTLRSEGPGSLPVTPVAFDEI